MSVICRHRIAVSLFVGLFWLASLWQWRGILTTGQRTMSSDYCDFLSMSYRQERYLRYLHLDCMHPFYTECREFYV